MTVAPLTAQRATPILRQSKKAIFTVTTRAEVPVAAKEAHVVEEVVIGKNVTEHEETVRDTVKRTDVEVEETDVDINTQTKKARS